MQTSYRTADRADRRLLLDTLDIMEYATGLNHKSLIGLMTGF